MIVLANGDDILCVAESGGTPEMIVPLRESGWVALSPVVLPGGDWVFSTLRPVGGTQRT